ncbi:uncharacterized protein UMAG_02066 [Mycosarcoma maydis]|uniref:GYF domain-containing protein n=1 Tax=Mycosarcoma maydis TaxID=5270 RepID=A0A0D1C7P5_MYCMD|nr:uncharacterized protein UMAG_02066 [Ustilago maydis 521]KIS69527.1 hypothetical protein UMAG_02066 [Ustilago maydis 521]|eukprot:XP_011388444.1 hypothetical protein UMAG_02066 [Ustilago maydis 521]
MATSMQFGPEWMRKGPNSKSGGKETSISTTTSAATSPGTGTVAGNAIAGNGSTGANAGVGKRNGGSNGLGNLSGPTPVVSPAVISPGAFSFAAAAAAATAQTSNRNGTHSSAQHGTWSGHDGDGSAALLNGSSAALAKDKVTREKLLSLYSSDRTSKVPSAEPSPVDSVAPGAGSGSGAEHPASTSRRKGASDRRPSAFTELGAVGGGPLSPGLNANEPRGLNARSTSGSSTGGFGSAVGSTWDKAEKERPGLFQRASSGALAGVTSNSGSRPLSPSVSRDRFSGIQGGVLSAVAPPARKRMDSSDGAAGTVDAPRSGRSLRGSQDEISASQTTNGSAATGSWGRSTQNSTAHPNAVGTGGGVLGAFSDAFSSNRVRGRNASAAADAAPLTAASAAPHSTDCSQPSQPIVPSGNSEGLSISARFARHKDRLPGEGPIGPPSDGSIGFGKSSGLDRRRERQTSQARLLQPHASKGDNAAASIGSAVGVTDAGQDPTEGAIVETQAPVKQNAGTGESTLGSDDPDLAQHASAVLGSLKLDEDDSPALPSASALAPEQNLANNADDFPRERDVRDHFDQSHPHHSSNMPLPTLQSATSWSPETSLWLYRDMAGNVQGPFSSLMMQDWYSQQYFADDLLVKRHEDVDFKPLAQVVAGVGNALQPFLIPPMAWLHPPALARSAFDPKAGASDSLLSNEQSRFTDSFDRTWPGQSGRPQQQSQQLQQQQHQSHQQGWPAPLNLGGLTNVAPSPASPFGRHDIFSAGQSGLRNQDDLISILRERELHEQRQAAAASASRGPGGMHLGQLDSFGAGLGRSGWGNESAMPPSHWGAGIGHGALGQFGDVGLGGHQSPHVGDRPVFESFGHQQRQNFDQNGSPWSNKASLNAPRSQLDSMRPAQHGQWGEQQAPWNYSATTPDVSNRQIDFSEAVLRNEAIKAADPIGTPRRARSPAPQHDHDVTQAQQQAGEHIDELHKSFENAFPAPAQEAQNSVDMPSVASSAAAPGVTSDDLEVKAPKETELEAITEADKTATTPQNKSSKKETQKATAAAAVAAVSPTISAAQDAPVTAKSIDSEIPPPEAFTTGEPRPEELWPQSPKAVEFAPEPELSSVPALTISSNKSAKDSKRESRSGLQRQSSDVSRIVSGSGEPANRAAGAAARSTVSGNVRVVSQEQFRRGTPSASTATQQVPLSDWINDGSSAEPSAPASRPAPWAAAKDEAPQPTGPSLREIQEAEAKRAEAKRAAEKAAARARMAASPSAVEDLPTTLSWGLASAPASASKNVSNSAATSSGSGANEAAPAAPAPFAPAWNAGKTAPKKTLMEIQEEERKRAEKLKAQQSAQAIALRKGYADSASRSTSASNLHGSVVGSSTNAGGGGAWSVVGASGKSSAPSTPSGGASAGSAGYGTSTGSPLTTRAPTASRATSSVATSSAGSAWSVVGARASNAPASPSPLPSPASRISASTSSMPASKPTRLSTDPNAPSPEFIKYCKDNLQGLTIKTDDFIDMLLQFPLDPSGDVIEIIADTVYANSSTLDGRRFANDFVTKRKMDVQGRGAVARTNGAIGNLATSKSGAPKNAHSDKWPHALASDTGFKLVKGKGAKAKRS